MQLHGRGFIRKGAFSFPGVENRVRLWNSSTVFRICFATALERRLSLNRGPRGPLECLGDLQHGAFPEMRTEDLHAHRKPGLGLAARDRDTRNTRERSRNRI